MFHPAGRKHQGPDPKSEVARLIKIYDGQIITARSHLVVAYWLRSLRFDEHKVEQSIISMIAKYLPLVSCKRENSSLILLSLSHTIKDNFNPPQITWDNFDKDWVKVSENGTRVTSCNKKRNDTMGITSSKTPFGPQNLPHF